MSVHRASDPPFIAFRRKKSDKWDRPSNRGTANPTKSAPDAVDPAADCNQFLQDGDLQR
jgi:hypothetical protein